MSIFRPKHPLLKAIVALGSGLFYLFTIPFVRRTIWDKVTRKKGVKVVDATAKVIDDERS